MQFLKAIPLVLSLVNLACGTSSFSPARPPALPLAVRSPYLSAWLQAGSDGGNGGYLPGEWPTFWTGATLGWVGMISVDGNYYLWMGKPYVNAALATQTSYTYTSTRSTFEFNIADTINLTVEFLSPVVPNDTMRSSLPITYMNVLVVSTDGKTHAVSVYTDISAEWISGNPDNIAEWDFGVIPGAFKHVNVLGTGTSTEVEARNEKIPEPVGDGLPKRAVSYSTFGTKTQFTVSTVAPVDEFVTPSSVSSSYAYPSYSGVPKIQVATGAAALPVETASGIAYHKIYRQTQQVFSEVNDQAEWGNWYYTTANTTALTYQSGKDTDVRGAFLFNGKLSNYQDTGYRAINDDYPVFGYCTNMGNVGTTTVASLFSLSLHQTEAVQFEGAYESTKSLPSLWTTYWSSDLDALSFFYKSFGTISDLCTATDDLVSTASIAAAGQNYLTITSLAVRQAFGTLVLAYDTATKATYAFMKEISSDGNIQTVDVLYPMHPIIIYMNPVWLKWLLEPLFVNQEAGNWPNTYSIHDLGSFFPNATGHNNGADESQPLEECGDMIIMTLAYAQRTDDNTFLSDNYDLLRQWNDYLVSEALIPAYQISTDDFAGPLGNQTNLAIKGIIGIAAMAQIASRTGNTADYKNFTSIAKSYIKQWETYAINTASPAHTTLNYGNESTYSLLYNLYADRELGLGLVPKHVYNIESGFYPTVALDYGVPLDTRHLYTKLDWQMLCAAIASTSTRNMFFSKIATWISETDTNHPMTDLYMANNGSYPIGDTFAARPVVGAVFGLLALQSAP